MNMSYEETFFCFLSYYCLGGSNNSILNNVKIAIIEVHFKNLKGHFTVGKKSKFAFNKIETTYLQGSAANNYNSIKILYYNL